MNIDVSIRIALGYLCVIALQLGVWATFWPRSFYDDFPGLGGGLIHVDGPYNEHLVRDVGALNLALASLLIFAALTLRRSVVMAAAIASLVWTLPHLVYHAFNTDGLSGADIAMSLGGLVASAVVPALILVTARRALPD